MRSSSSFDSDDGDEAGEHIDDNNTKKKKNNSEKEKTTNNNNNNKKMEPAQVAKTFERQWVKIGDLEYDITDMKHPGGSVIYYMLSNVGADATEAFREFHYRSKKAEKMLKLLPQRKYEAKNHSKDNNSNYQPIDTSDSAMLKDFASFRLGLEKEGYFTPSPGHVAYRIVELVFMFALATCLMAKGYTKLSVITYGAFFGARCGWVQHEGGHNSLTGNIWIDKRIQACLMGFGLGTSGDMWNVMHNKHHATPQKIRHDMDLDTTPAVAFFDTAVEENRDRGFSRLWSRFQAWTFVPITSGVFVMAFWLYVLHPSKVFKKKNWEEAFWMLSSHVVRASLIQLVHPGDVSFARAWSEDDLEAVASVARVIDAKPGRPVFPAGASASDDLDLGSSFPPREPAVPRCCMRRDTRDLSELASPPSSSAGASATSFPSTSPTRLAPCHLHAPLLMRSVTPTASSTFMTSYSRRRFTPRRSASASTGTFPCQLAVDPPPRDYVPDPSA